MEEIAANILSPKLKSPPPKPPRRSFSDQLPISSATLPLSKKKSSHKKEHGAIDILSKYNSSTCDSLPSDWTTNVLSDTKSKSTHLIKSASQLHFNKCTNFHTIIPDDLLITKNPKTISDFSCINNSFKQQVKSTNFFTKYNAKSSGIMKCKPYNIDEYSDKTYESVNNSVFFVENENSEYKTKLEPKEQSKRHHSDPVIPYIDEFKPENGAYKSTFRSHSFLGCSSFDSKKNRHKTVPNFFRMKELQCLYDELRVSKEISDKLWHFLCSAQESLEAVEGKQHTNSCSISNILLSLYQSYKIKENAMDDRMNFILKERDSAVQELEDMVQIIARSFQDRELFENDKNPDKEIRNILKEIETTYDPARLLKQQRLLLSYLYHSKELNETHLAHKLKESLLENDNLLEQINNIEEELETLKLSCKIWNTDSKNWESNLLKIICQVIHQRDLALCSSESIKEMNHIIKVSKDSCELQGDIGSSSRLTLQKSNSNNIEQSSNLLEEIDVLRTEIQVLNQALNSEIEKRKLADANCLRLERLVSVLQRKVHSQNVGIPV